jgi:hypothetical protein
LPEASRPRSADAWRPVAACGAAEIRDLVHQTGYIAAIQRTARGV